MLKPTAYGPMPTGGDHFLNHRLREHLPGLPQESLLDFDRESGKIRRRGPEACGGHFRIDVPLCVHGTRRPAGGARGVLLTLRKQRLLVGAVRRPDRIENVFAHDLRKRFADDVR